MVTYTVTPTQAHTLRSLIDFALAYIEDCCQPSAELTPQERFAMAALIAVGGQSHIVLAREINAALAALPSPNDTLTVSAPSPYVLPAIVTLATLELGCRMTSIDHCPANVAEEIEQLYTTEVAKISAVLDAQTPDTRLAA